MQSPDRLIFTHWLLTFQRDLRFAREKLNRIQVLASQGSIPSNAFLPFMDSEQKSSTFSGESDETAYLSLMLAIGAADISAISTWSFPQAMLLFPEVQAKARKAIIDVVGDRIPAYSDIDRVPYVRCLMKETWRWRPLVALGHPHITTQNLTYNGVRVPKGAQIHLNSYAIQHDPNRYPNPSTFVPERFEHDPTTSQQSMNAADVSQRDHFAFGSGRRVCPGYHVAERSLAIAIMCLLWAFTITPSKNAKLPLDPLEFEGEVMPGTADRRMPVCLKIVSEDRRRQIDVAFDEEVAGRVAMKPLVVKETGQGAFKMLDFRGFGSPLKYLPTYLHG